MQKVKERMRKNLLKDERAVSAVIATVIIVAVTIAVAIAVAYWMGGLATVFTRFEKIEVKSAYVVKLTTGDPPVTDYEITLNFVNTGATATSVDSVMLNGVPFGDWGTAGVTVTLGDYGDVAGFSLIGTTPLPCPTGVSLGGTITFEPGIADPSGNQLSPGVTVTITLHSSHGNDYHASVTLP